MKPLLPLPVLATAVLCSCSAVPEKGGLELSEGGRQTPMSVQTLAASLREPALHFKKVRLTAWYHAGGISKDDPLGSVEAPAGKTVKLARLNDMPYPTDFTLPVPGTGQTQGESVFRPVRPGGFKTRNAGIVLEVTATAKGPWVVLRGKTTTSELERLASNPGEPFGPIKDAQGNVLSDNKLRTPQFTDRVTHFMTAVRPGGGVSIPLNSDKNGSRLHLTVEPDTTD